MIGQPPVPLHSSGNIHELSDDYATRECENLIRFHASIPSEKKKRKISEKI